MSLTARENILNKIQQALKQQVPLPFNETKQKFVFNTQQQDLDIEFAEQFTALQGKFIYCTNLLDLAEQFNQLCLKKDWKKLVCAENELIQILNENSFSFLNNNTPLANCDAAITSCEALISRTGSFLLSSNTESGRDFSVYAPIHICIAFTNQLVYDISDGLNRLKEKYKSNRLPSFISLATGPSRTADIEKTLVVGVHGPKEVYCFLVESQ